LLEAAVAEVENLEMAQVVPVVLVVPVDTDILLVLIVLHQIL
jgi:hypothetical protein